MKLSETKNYDDLPLFLNAEMVAKVLGVSILWKKQMPILLHIVKIISQKFIINFSRTELAAKTLLIFKRALKMAHTKHALLF